MSANKGKVPRTYKLNNPRKLNVLFSTVLIAIFCSDRYLSLFVEVLGTQESPTKASALGLGEKYMSS